MPHAHKTCQKKEEEEKMHTHRRYATCPQGMSKKKREEEKENIAHTKNITREREII